MSDNDPAKGSLSYPAHSMRAASLRIVVVAALVMPLTPALLTAQWRVSVEPAAGSRPPTVTTVVRERADSIVAEEEVVQFVMRCTARQLEAFISTRDRLVSDMAADVRVRVESDSARGRDARWQATKANTGAFVPAPELRELIQRHILRSPTLRIIIATEKRGRVTYTFPTANFRPSLDALRDACPNDRGGALAEPNR